MKTKTTRLVDPQGRVSIPGYLRELASINPGDTVTVEVGEDNAIRIYGSSDRCCICGKRHEPAKMLQAPDNQRVCFNCAKTIASTLKK